MNIKFKRTKDTRVIVSNDLGKTIAQFNLIDAGWKYTPKEGVELAEGAIDTICEKFAPWLAEQEAKAADQMPEGEVPLPPQPVPSIAPLPDPISGTTSAEYIAYAADHFTKEAFTELYEPRWADPKFRAFAQAVAPNFFTRCKELFL